MYLRYYFYCNRNANGNLLNREGNFYKIIHFTIVLCSGIYVGGTQFLLIYDVIKEPSVICNNINKKIFIVKQRLEEF